MPENIARARGGRADVGVAVVAVDAPRVEDALEVDQLVARPPQMVHHFLLPALDQRVPDAPADVVEHRVPGHALPLALAASGRAPQRIEDALRIRDLVEGRRALGAVAAPAPRMHRVALELVDLEGLDVDVGEQPAGRLAVEADRGDELEAALDLARPRLAVQLLPVVPSRRRRKPLQP